MATRSGGAVDDSTTRNRLTLVKGSVVGQAYVPDVCGMGARDAVYLMESRGIKARINGRGVVVSQSLKHIRHASEAA